MGALSLSSKSLTGRLMLAFGVLGILLLLLVSLGSVSLHWLKQADVFLYDKSLPASQAARQLSQATNALSDGARQLSLVEDEQQRQFIGRRLSIESANMLNSISALESLDVETGKDLAHLAGQIVDGLSRLGQQIGQRLIMAARLQQQAHSLSLAASHTSSLLQAELAVVDSAILAKLSLAYPNISGVAQSELLLDDVIERELDTQEQLNRALKLVHQIALLSQLFESSELQSELQLSVPRLLATFSQTQPVTAQALGMDTDHQAMDEALDKPPLQPVQPHQTKAAQASGIDLMALHIVPELIRDPGRREALKAQLAMLLDTQKVIQLQQELSQRQQRQQRRQQDLEDKLYGLNTAVDKALSKQLKRAESARDDYLTQLSLARIGLWGTGLLMFVVMGFVIYRVIYRGIALRLNEATRAMSRLSMEDANVNIDAQGDDELTAMANAIEAFKRKTAHNLKLQTDLRQVADELTQHKKALEQTVAARTQELADANKQLNAEAHGHSQARLLAEEANQAKSLFLATMSHEIRTPLNGLLGTLTLLGHSHLPPAQQQLLALSQYSGTLLQTVLNDILDFSRLEQGKLHHDPRPTDINALLDEVQAIMLAGANLAGLQLLVDKSPLPCCIQIDGPKLRQVLFNLLGNAIKFTPAGDIRLSVQLELGAEDDKRLKVIVADTGIGIAAEAMDTLFIPYHSQPSQGRSRGTGLGLSICKQLVSLMADNSSSIWVESELGKGSRFGFSLPFTECDEALAVPSQAAPQVLSQRVLVIEDNKVNAMVAQGFLAHLGHSSALALSCQQALALLTQDVQFDAVMLDIQLGDGSGLALLAQLQSLLGADVRFAAFTAQIQADDVALYQQLGFDTVLAKPLSLATLTDWLGVAVRLPSLSAIVQAQAENLQQSVSSKALSQDELALLDLTQLEQDCAVLGVDAVQGMLALFIHSSEAQLLTLSPASSTPQAASDLHALKGSSASMGCVALAQYCKALEISLKAASSACLSENEYQHLQHIWQGSISALQRYLS